MVTKTLKLSIPQNDLDASLRRAGIEPTPVSRECAFDYLLRSARLTFENHSYDWVQIKEDIEQESYREE